jgi:hypothetical protein
MALHFNRATAADLERWAAMLRTVADEMEAAAGRAVAELRDEVMSVVAGTRINNWTVINVDPNGARCVCECRCGTTRILSTRALADGTAAPSCGCLALTREQLRALRAEAASEGRLREARDAIRKWKPGERR